MPPSAGGVITAPIPGMPVVPPSVEAVKGSPDQNRGGNEGVENRTGGNEGRGQGRALGGAQGEAGMLHSLGLRHLALEHQEELALLSGLNGQMFDEGYIGNQVKAHSKMLAMFELHARTARDSQVRSFAARSLPVVQAHLQMARQLAGLGADPGGRGRGRIRSGGSGQDQGGQFGGSQGRGNRGRGNSSGTGQGGQNGGSQNDGGQNQGDQSNPGQNQGGGSGTGQGQSGDR